MADMSGAAQAAGSAGGGGTLGWWGKVVEGIGHTGQWGVNLYGAWGGYMNAKLASTMQKFDADQMRYYAKDHLRSAEGYMATAGKTQRAGEEEAVNRYLQLGQDIGRIYAGAAGGNIEVTSGVVRNVESAARIMADRDVSAINRSTADRTNAYVNAAASERMDYVREMTQARMIDIGARLNRKLAKTNMYSGMISATGKFLDRMIRMGMSDDGGHGSVGG